MEAPRTVAIVGSRDANAEAMAFARGLAATLSRHGVVVVSGGAVGIDAAAHRGALDASGRTWAIAGTGCEHCFPREHARLFDTIAAGPGAMLWPFPPSSAARAGAFPLRNRVLVALSDAVVVAQAGLPSGALRAAACARIFQKPLWVVPAPPWLSGFGGSHMLLEAGVRPLTSIDRLLQALGLIAGREPATSMKRHGELSKDPILSTVLEAMGTTPLHVDELAHRAHLTVQAVAVALLTLALEAVVVEGPPGFFRRCESGNP